MIRTVMITFLLCSALLGQGTVRLALGGPDVQDAAGMLWKGTPCPAGSLQFTTVGLHPSIAESFPVYKNMCYAANSMETVISNLENGSYLVKLLYIDPQVATAGVRQFDVIMNGQLTHKALDVAAQAGMLNPWTTGAVIYVTEGRLAIKSVKVYRNAILSGIQVHILSGGTVAQDLGGVLQMQVVPEGSETTQPVFWFRSTEGRMIGPMGFIGPGPIPSALKYPVTIQPFPRLVK